MIHCNEEMELFGSIEGNGWRCIVCGYIHWDIVSCPDN